MCVIRSISILWGSANSVDPAQTMQMRRLVPYVIGLISISNGSANTVDPDQAVRMRRLIWAYAGRACHMIDFYFEGLYRVLTVSLKIGVQKSFSPKSRSR